MKEKKEINSFANSWSFSNNHKDIGNLYMVLLIIIFLIGIIVTIVATVVIIDQNFPEILLMEKAKEFYSKKITPRFFFYLLLPLAINWINVFLLSYVRKWFLLLLFGETLILFLLKPWLIKSDFFPYNEKMVYIGIVTILFLGISGYFFMEKMKRKNEVARNEAQTIIYKKFLPKHRLLDTINYFFNTIIVYLGSYEIPTKIGFKFLLLCLSAWSLAIFMLFSDLFRIEMLIGMSLISFSFRYESIQNNYQNNLAFKKNFDINSRYWFSRLSKSDSVIKRYYCTRIISATINKVGSVTLVNPPRRTLMILGGGFVACGVVGGGLYGYKIYSNEKIEMEKIKSNERIELGNLAIKNKELDYAHEENMKKIDNAKKSGWRPPWS